LIQRGKTFRKESGNSYFVRSFYAMPNPKPDLLLITGIPGTGKTCYGDKFASELGFLHYDVEDSATAQRLMSDPGGFIEELTRPEQNVVVTWGFHPGDSGSLEILRRLRGAGFNLIWFDGNRPAALSAFRKRGTVAEEAFILQLQRIENTKIVERLKPTIINSFDENSQFKPAKQILQEIRMQLNA
jgi:hypothetical protein